MTTTTLITESDQVTTEILEAAEQINDGWLAGKRFNMDTREELIDRLDGTTLDDGTVLDLGDDAASAAIIAIENHIRKYRRTA